MNRARALRVKWICLFLPLLNCSQSIQYSGGSGADVETKVTGYAVDSNGNPVAAARVYLRQADYLFPIENTRTESIGQCLDTVTDGAGGFCFDSVVRGSYLVEINDRKGSAAAVRFTISDSTKSVALGINTLIRTAVVQGVLPAELRRGRQWFVRIYGLERIAASDSISGKYLFPDIPSGSYSFHLMTIAPDIEPIITDTVKVVSGDTVSIPAYPTWKYSRRLTLNTTAEGADVSGDVTGFPVLIRLTSDNFDFSGARPDGADIRFTKANGTPLSYEIEKWDMENGEADVWVKTDTIYGNDSTQYIVMYWGNPEAADRSNSAAVFDTASGFAGVWHMGQTAGTTVADATANRFHGTSTATVPVPGTIGTAQSFDGKSSMIEIAGPATSRLNFLPEGSFTVSAWAMTAAGADSLFHAVLFKSNFQYGIQINRSCQWEFVTFIDKSGWVGSHFPASADRWHFIAGVRQGNKQYLYVDGTCVDSIGTFMAGNFSLAEDTPFHIGHCPDGGLDPDRYFKGAVDEVRISNTAKSPDWIKLCYMNQKTPDALVRW